MAPQVLLWRKVVSPCSGEDLRSFTDEAAHPLTHLCNVLLAWKKRTIYK